MPSISLSDFTRASPVNASYSFFLRYADKLQMRASRFAVYVWPCFTLVYERSLENRMD
jgi:hypothetical protein